MPGPEQPQQILSPSQRWEAIQTEAREQRTALATIARQTRDTQTAARLIMENLRGSNLTYQRFYLGDHLVIQNMEGGTVQITYDGDKNTAKTELEKLYPKETHDIISLPGGWEVKTKAGACVARAQVDNAPRFIRAVLAYNEAVDGGTLRRAGWQSGTVTHVLAGEHAIVASRGNQRYKLDQYLRNVLGISAYSITLNGHRVTVIAEIPPDTGSIDMQRVLNNPNRVDVLVDQRAVFHLRRLRPIAALARTASTPAQREEARKQLNESLRRLNLPDQVYDILIMDLLGPDQVTSDQLRLLRRCSNVQFYHTRPDMGQIMRSAQAVGAVPQAQWQQLRQAGLVRDPPTLNQPGENAVSFHNTTAGNLGISLHDATGVLDLTGTLPAGMHFAESQDFVYTPTFIGVNVADLRYESGTLFALFHELGHADDTNLQRHGQEITRLVGRYNRIAGQINNNPRLRPPYSASLSSVQELLRIQRRIALLQARIERAATINALRRLQETPNGRRVWRHIRGRFHNLSQFYEFVQNMAYSSYLRSVQQQSLNVPLEDGQVVNSQLDFTNGVFDSEFFSGELEFFWALGDIENIEKLSGAARAHAIEEFNTHYGPFHSKKAHLFKKFNEGSVLALDSSGKLREFRTEQDYNHTLEVVQATNANTMHNAQSVIDRLEQFHNASQQVSGTEEMLDITKTQLDALTDVLRIQRHAGNVLERVRDSKRMLSAAGFSLEQICFLTCEGHFGMDVATRERGFLESRLSSVPLPRRALIPGGLPGNLTIAQAVQVGQSMGLTITPDTDLATARRLIEEKGRVLLRGR